MYLVHHFLVCCAISPQPNTLQDVCIASQRNPTPTSAHPHLPKRHSRNVLRLSVLVAVACASDAYSAAQRSAMWHDLRAGSAGAIYCSGVTSNVPCAAMSLEEPHTCAICQMVMKTPQDLKYTKRAAQPLSTRLPAKWSRCTLIHQRLSRNQAALPHRSESAVSRAHAAS